MTGKDSWFRIRTVLLRCSAIAATLMLAALAWSAPRPAMAAGEVRIELNRLASGPKGCLVSFVMQNGIGVEIEDLSLEVVLFDKEGRVDRILLLSSGSLPRDKTRVKQFELEGTECTGISQILLNDVSSCKGEGLDSQSCLASLKLESRAEVKFGL